MKSRRIMILIAILVLSGLACRLTGSGNESQPQVPQVTPELATEMPPVPTDTVAPMPTEAPVDVPVEPVDFEKTCAEIPNFQVCVPKELASALVASTVAAADTADTPFWAVMPEHHVIELQGYPLTNTFLKPKIHIIPAADYFMMAEGALMTGNELMEMMESRDAHPKSLPILPLVNATSVMIARANYIETEPLHGVEALTLLAQSYAVINNYSMIYTFQGITNDEKYWIGIVLPITQNSLPADDSVVPGAHFQTFADQYETYSSEVEATLDSATPDSFSPSYDVIQGVINSITYTP